MPAKSAGRSGHRWRTLKAQFRASCERAGAPCWLCGQRIDYTLKHPHPEAWEPDHYYPVSLRPELAEDIANLRPAHHSCNITRGNRDAQPSIGRQSRQW